LVQWEKARSGKAIKWKCGPTKTRHPAADAGSVTSNEVEFSGSMVYVEMRKSGEAED